MKVKVFRFNCNGKIEFTRAELEKLLNEIYEEGKRDCESNHPCTCTSPYINMTPCFNNDIVYTTNTTEAQNENTSVETAQSTIPNPKEDINEYCVSVKFNNNDNIAKAINDIIKNTSKSIRPSQRVEDVFDTLAKELAL